MSEVVKNLEYAFLVSHPDIDFYECYCVRGNKEVLVRRRMKIFWQGFDMYKGYNLWKIQCKHCQGGSIGKMDEIRVMLENSKNEF